MAKYRLTEETKEFRGRTLHRIECVESFADVKVGDKGGWVESENNLSQLGECWVADDAKVYGNAEVRDDAKISENAIVYGYATIFGNAKVYGFAEVK